MENKKYTVKRDSIYVGEVVRLCDKVKIARTLTAAMYDDRYKLYTNHYFRYRSTLFVPNEQGLSDDLLYRSPNYPVINVSPFSSLVNLDRGDIAVNRPCNLEELLKYYGFKEDLTFEDIKIIRDVFFSGHFAKDNCELFGFHEHQPEEAKYSVNGKEVTDPRELAKIIAEAKREQAKGHRSFYSTGQGELSTRYFHLLDDMGNSTFTEVRQGWAKRIDAFKPDKEEGKIHKLK